MKLKRAIIGFFILILLGLAYWFRLGQIPAYHIPEDQAVKVVGRVSQQPYLKGSNQIIEVGPIMIITTRFPGYFYGQKLEIVGKFTARVTGRFQKQFLTYYPTIHLVKGDEKNGEKPNLVTVLLKTRGRLETIVENFLAEPQASLLLGIVFGAKGQMPLNFWERLRQTGTLHIVVASGQNVSIVARFLIGILVLAVNRRRAVILAVLGVVFYVLMVGGEAPVVRAAIMATLAFLAQMFGKEEEGTLALVLAAVVMLLVSPLLLFELSFQLSFAATAGIIWLYPRLKPKKLFSWPLVGEALASTIAAQAGVLPLLLTNFGQFSLLSPIINALVLWTVPYIMILGFIMAISGLIIKPVAEMLSWFAWLLLTYFVKVIEVFGKLPWITWEIGRISGWWAMVYYFGLGLLIWKTRETPKKE